MRRRTIVLCAAAGLVVAVPVAAYGVLVVASSDAPPPASLAPLPSTIAPAPVADGASPAPTTAAPTAAEGTWTIAPVDTNFAGYRIRERLGPVAAPSDVVARTNNVVGTAVIEGSRLTALDVTVDLSTLESPGSREQTLRTEALETDTYPTASFHVTEPIELGTPEVGRVIDVALVGELTLHGVTHEVTVPIQARWDGPTIQVAGSLQIRRDDYDIDVSGIPGYSVAETGTFEFELTLAPDGSAVTTPASTIVEAAATTSVVPNGEDSPPCTDGDPALTLPRPVLVAGATDTGPSFELIGGSNQITSLVPPAGLTGGATWSPDGSQILYASTPDPIAPRRFFVMPADGGEPLPMGEMSWVKMPDWGPDGRVVYVQEHPGAVTNGPDEVWVADADGANARLLVETPGSDTEPRWSPDGTAIVFTTYVDENLQEVMLINPDGTGLRTLAGGPGYEYAPAFSPDGSTVLFARDGALTAIGIDGRGERQLTEGPADINPALSPDGSQLAFLRFGSLFIADADGSNAQCILTGQTMASGPRWQP